MTGLRELKKERTRHDIVVATLELTLEDSYRATTIPLIAERAMVSPHTVSAYFPNKDDIAFDNSDEVLAELDSRLAEDDARPARLRDDARARGRDDRGRPHDDHDGGSSRATPHDGGGDRGDTQHARAVSAGLRPEFSPHDGSWGERYFHIVDPDGHELSFARPI